jgi:hypothetical protein
MRRYDSYFNTFHPVDGEPPPTQALLYDAWSLTDRRGFWPAHFYDVIEDEDLIADVWRVGLDVVEETGNLLADPRAWPLFEVELGAGAALAVIYRNLKDELGIDYLVSAGRDGEWVEIASIEGHFRGPGLSWPELARVGRRQRSEDQARTLLLLAPILGDIEAEQNLEAIAQAIRSCGGTGDVETLASLIASENRYFEAARWSTTRDGVIVCDGDYARRTRSMPPNELRAVSDALGGGG